MLTFYIEIYESEPYSPKRELRFKAKYNTTLSSEEVFKYLTQNKKGHVFEGREVSLYAFTDFAEFAVEIMLGDVTDVIALLDSTSTRLDLHSDDLSYPIICSSYVQISDSLTENQIQEIAQYVSNISHGEFSTSIHKRSYELGLSGFWESYLIGIAGNLTVDLVKWIANKFFRGDTSVIEIIDVPNLVREYIHSNTGIQADRLILIKFENIENNQSKFIFSYGRKHYHVTTNEKHEVTSYSALPINNYA